MKYEKAVAKQLFHFRLQPPIFIGYQATRGHYQNMYRVFVYGTLKRNQPNYDVMTELGDNVKYIGEATTVEKFPLVVGTENNIPFLLFSPGKGYNVRGEIYEVNQAALEVLDEFEDCGDVYDREEILVVSRESLEKTRAWAYVYKAAGLQLMNSPCLENYDHDEMVKQGKAYGERSEDARPITEVAYQLKL